VSLAAVAALAVAAPAASAHKAPSAAGVAAHAKKADRYMASFKRHVAKKHPRTALKRLRVARTETSLAAREARSLRHAAVSPTQLTNAAGALALSTDQYAQLMAMITGLIDEVRGIVRDALAEIVPAVINAHNQLLGMLTQMLPMIPAPAQGSAATAITQVATTGTAALAPMQEALAGGVLLVAVAAILNTAFQAVSGALTMALDSVEAIIPALPAVAAGPVSQVLTLVTGILTSVIGRIGAVGTGATVPTGLAGGITGIVNGVMGSMNNLLGSLFGSLLRGYFPAGSFGYGAAPAAPAAG
jgi:hypothetical protein